MYDLDDIKQSIRYAMERERELNIHLGHSPTYHKGSMTISLRWDEVLSLVNEIETLRQLVGDEDYREGDR